MADMYTGGRVETTFACRACAQVDGTAGRHAQVNLRDAPQVHCSHTRNILSAYHVHSLITQMFMTMDVDDSDSLSAIEITSGLETFGAFCAPS